MACHVKWVAPMDKRCMTMRPELGDAQFSEMMFSDHVTYVFVVGSVQLGELGLCLVRDPGMCCVWRHPLSALFCSVTLGDWAFAGCGGRGQA
ncbi:LOW QUALITY PROTEIN: hypothetical protein YC2023_067196 [Brassica napus]